MGLLTERTFSELLRSSGDVLAQAEHRDVLLRRRDGADMMLVEADRETALREALVMAATLLSMVINEMDSPGSTKRGIEDVAPWTRFLPPEDRRGFLSEFVGTARACGEIDNFGPLAQLLREWKATAAIHADPQLLTELRAPAEKGRRAVPRP